MLALCPMPGRGGDFAGDLARLRGWRPDLVVSMTESHEMAADLPGALAGAGIGWRHFPVVDYGVPDGGFDGLAAGIAGVLARGGRVLLHCMGGCGRSGMVALAVMVRAGEAPDAALARLRAVRPCAVETAAQQAWASDQPCGAGA
jgi:protein-tyrosine phosphatase